MASTVPECRQSLREARMSRQRKHKRRLYAKLAPAFLPFWEAAFLPQSVAFRDVVDEWLDEKWGALAACTQRPRESHIFLGIPLACPPYIVSVTVTP